MKPNIEPNKESTSCCICGKPLGSLWGNNPWPVIKIENARCCDECNINTVIPARIKAMAKNKESSK